MAESGAIQGRAISSGSALTMTNFTRCPKDPCACLMVIAGHKMIQDRTLQAISPIDEVFETKATGSVSHEPQLVP